MSVSAICESRDFARQLARFEGTHSMLPTPWETWPNLAVEPDRLFDRPAFNAAIGPKHEPEWLKFHIDKSLAGFDMIAPSPTELVEWFHLKSGLEPVQGEVIDDFMAELHRFGGMPLLAKLADTLGLSVREIARVMREAPVRSAYPCLWINQFVWRALPPPADAVVMGPELKTITRVAPDRHGGGRHAR